MVIYNIPAYCLGHSNHKHVLNTGFSSSWTEKPKFSNFSRIPVCALIHDHLNYELIDTYLISQNVHH